MIKVNEDADMLKVLRRIPHIVMVYKSLVATEKDEPIVLLARYCAEDSAMQGMKL